MPDQHADPPAVVHAGGGPPVPDAPEPHDEVLVHANGDSPAAEPYEEPQIAVYAKGATTEAPITVLYEEPRITRHINGASRTSHNQDALEPASEQAPAADGRVAELDLLADRARERLSLLIGLCEARWTQPQGDGGAGDRKLTASLGDRPR